MTTKRQAIQRIIESNPEVYGKDKHRAIYAVLETDRLSPETIAQVQSYDRAWRKVLQEYPDLDHRDSTRAQELAVQRDLGYNV